MIPIFPHRCKLFYKKDNEFKEKGVGTLHLKPTTNQKTQLLVRADTNLGGYLFFQVAQVLITTWCKRLPSLTAVL